MIHAVIVDDEARSCDVLSKILKMYCPDVLVDGIAYNIETARKIITDLQPELVFLDIELPDGNSFRLIEELGPVNFKIIFITAFSDFAIKAFKSPAIDYLLKPLNIDELIAAVDKYKQLLQARPAEAVTLNDTEQLKTIGLATLTEIQFVDVDDIIRLEASNNYTCFYMADGEKITVSHTIKYYEELLQRNSFMRVHQSHIINLRKVKKYQKGKGGFIVMANGDAVQISTQRKDPLLKALTGGTI